MSIGNIFFQVDNKGATYSYLTTVIDDAKGCVAEPPALQRCYQLACQGFTP